MKTVLSIEGMSCAHCVKHVTEALEELGGVKSVSVSLEEKTAAIEHEDGVSIDSMKDAVTEVGFEAAVL